MVGAQARASVCPVRRSPPHLPFIAVPCVSCVSSSRSSSLRLTVCEIDVHRYVDSMAETLVANVISDFL